ncbi:MAG: hypothetical protein NTZ78_13895 [Candidatus Aureabacteria bacterium]|nr:hypothetical protein [Candidatus Auribacterota bacterium]
MRIRLDLLVRGALLLALAGAGGCSVVDSAQRLRDAHRAMSEADKAVTGGDFSTGLKSYLRARKQLVYAREAGFGYFAGDKKIESIDRAIIDLDRSANDAGFVRVDDRYLAPEELGESLRRSLEQLFREGHIGAISQERIVPESFSASARSAGENKFDIALSFVAKDVGEETDFEQDVWGVAKFFMEGGYGNGFSYSLTLPFAERRWMGREGVWGISDKKNMESHFIGLKGRIARISISVSRGRYRQKKGDQTGPYGFSSLKATGPYWKAEHYRTFTLRGDDAARLNWAQADRIPDATLYGMLEISQDKTEVGTSAVELERK